MIARTTLHQHRVYGHFIEVNIISKSESVGFQSLGLGSGDAKMHAPKNRNSSGTLLKSSGNLAGTMMEPCYARTLLELSWNDAGMLLEQSWNRASNLRGTFLELCWNLAGTILEPLDLCWNCAGTFLEPIWKFAGTSSEPCWNFCVSALVTVPTCDFSEQRQVLELCCFFGLLFALFQFQWCLICLMCWAAAGNWDRGGAHT